MRLVDMENTPLDSQEIINWKLKPHKEIVG